MVKINKLLLINGILLGLVLGEPAPIINGDVGLRNRLEFKKERSIFGDIVSVILNPFPKQTSKSTSPTITTTTTTGSSATTPSVTSTSAATTSSTISNSNPSTSKSATSSTSAKPTTTSTTTSSGVTIPSSSGSPSTSVPSSQTPVPSTSSSSSASTSTGGGGSITNDATCGRQNNNMVCGPSNPYGTCCSQYGYCGRSTDHCLPENNCQSGCTTSGTSSSGTTSASAPQPTTSGAPTKYTNSRYCGTRNGGLQCAPDGPYGPCCSSEGMCGGGDGFCLPSNGCQSGCSIVTEPPPKGCGDKFCDVRQETCYSCPGDCGPCDLNYIDKCTRVGQISLTFDDGPSDNAPNLLNQANQLGVKLTHFIIGQKLAQPNYRKFLVDFYNAGHAIASHTFTHPFLTHLTDDEIRAEMINTDDAIFAAIGVRPRYMRNPYSDSNQRTMALLQSMGYQSIFTSLDTQDTVVGTTNPPQILQNVLDGLNGTTSTASSFVLTQHETFNSSINYLPKIVQAIRDRGYTLPLIDQCRGTPGSLYRADVCGDRICSGYVENCATCPADCGACPP